MPAYHNLYYPLFYNIKIKRNVKLKNDFLGSSHYSITERQKI